MIITDGDLVEVDGVAYDVEALEGSGDQDCEVQLTVATLGLKWPAEFSGENVATGYTVGGEMIALLEDGHTVFKMVESEAGISMLTVIG